MERPAVAPSRRRFLLAGVRKTSIAPHCLSLSGIVCRTCGEHCEAGAIGFALLPGGRARPLVDDARCDSCGECARACPAQAIEVRA